MSDFYSKHYVVFGGSSGIGKGVALSLAKQGASVTIVGKTEVYLKETFRQLNFFLNESQKHYYIQADLSDLNIIPSLVSTFLAVDGFVFSAGIINSKPIQFLEIDEFLKLQNINSVSVVFLVKEFLKQRKLKQNSSIVLIGSISGTRVGYKGSVAYSFSKGALSGMLKSLALELAKFKIRINSILPAMVKDTNLGYDTAFSSEQLEADKDKYPLGDYLSVNDISGSVIHLLSNSSKMITGIELVIDCGYTLN